jgi:hypothetical protein
MRASSDELFKEIEKLHCKLDILKEDINAIKVQTTKTNGRVNYHDKAIIGVAVFCGTFLTVTLAIAGMLWSHVTKGG